MKFVFTILSLFFIASTLSAQILSWSPLYLTEDDSVSVVYDATQGSAGLMGYGGDVYMHTGVITAASGDPTDWRYVKTGWGQNTSETKLRRIDADLYAFSITPSIREYYGVPANEEVLQLAFVFRSATAPYLEGKTGTGGDIFLPLRTGLKIETPKGSPLFLDYNDTLHVEVISAPETESLTLFRNDTLLVRVEDDSLFYDLVADRYGVSHIRIEAENASGPFAEDSFYYVVNYPVTVQETPEGVNDGITKVDDYTTIFSLFAPNKEFVYLLGDFNDWRIDPGYFMKKTPGGDRYWLTVTGLSPAEQLQFQYLVDGKLRIADPYAEKVIDPWNDRHIPPETYPDLPEYPAGKTAHMTAAFHTKIDSYTWRAGDYARPAPEDLVIYELLLRDFIAEHDYATLIDTLGYFERLGVNAIELMPVNEFDGNISWGYNPAFYFAPDKYYGPAADLKRFIDECHGRGIAVILDIVLNHSFGQSPLVRLYNEGDYGAPTSENPWYNTTATHPYSVGYDFNHESYFTRAFVDRVNRYWLEEYRVDGFRFDLSKGFTQSFSGDNVWLWGQYDHSRIATLKRMADAIWAVDPNAYIILEHFAENQEEKELAEYRNGMMLWGNLNTAYSQSAMGWLQDSERSSDLSWGYYKNRGWTKARLVTYMESHDEPWLMYKNLSYGRNTVGYNIKELNTALDRMKLVSAFFFTIPGPKMLWQFGELGYDQYLADVDPPRTSPKPILWEYYEIPERRLLYETIAALISLRNQYSVFRNPETEVAMRVGQGQYDRTIHLSGDSMHVAILGNFDVFVREVNPNFQKVGLWYEYFSGDSLLVLNAQEEISLDPGAFRIYSDVKLKRPDIVSGVATESEGTFSFALCENYPNPFNATTSLQYTVSRRSKVSLAVYTILGRQVISLINEVVAPGEYSVIWDGTDENGTALPSGVYIAQLKSELMVLTSKMLLVR